MDRHLRGESVDGSGSSMHHGRRWLISYFLSIGNHIFVLPRRFDTDFQIKMWHAAPQKTEIYQRRKIRQYLLI